MAKHKSVKCTPAEMAYEMPAELDFSKLREIPGGFDGLRKHHAARLARRSVVLAPDVAKLFPTAQAVNTALRLVAQLSTTIRPKRKRSA